MDHYLFILLFKSVLHKPEQLYEHNYVQTFTILPLTDTHVKEGYLYIHSFTTRNQQKNKERKKECIKKKRRPNSIFL